MSVEQEAKAAAEAAYEVDVYTTEQVARGKRVPFAHGYVTGHAAAINELLDVGHLERNRLAQSNDVAGIVIDVVATVAPDLFVTLDMRYGIADMLWAAGYRKVQP